MKKQENSVPNEPLRLTSEFVFLNEYYGHGAKREKAGVKAIINYQEKTYKIMPAHSEGSGFRSNLKYFNFLINPMSNQGEAVPREEFEFIGERGESNIISLQKAIALSLLEAIEFVQKELKY